MLQIQDCTGDSLSWWLDKVPPVHVCGQAGLEPVLMSEGFVNALCLRPKGLKVCVWLHWWTLSLINWKGGTGLSYLYLPWCEHPCVHAGASKGTIWSASVYGADPVSAVHTARGYLRAPVCTCTWVPVCLEHTVSLAPGQACQWKNISHSHVSCLHWDRINLLGFCGEKDLLRPRGYWTPQLP